MKILIQGGRIIDTQSGMDAVGDVLVVNGRIASIGQAQQGFQADKVIDAKGCWVIPGLVDLNVRLGEPGGEHAQMLQSELAAAGAGGVTSVVCPPDTSPVLDEPGLVEMLKFRAQKRHAARVFPLGALTRGLKGESLTAMLELADAGCVGFGQANEPIVNTQTLQRAMQYAATHGLTVWLSPQDAWLGKGIAASGAYATRLGLAGIPVMAETIALQTIFDLQRNTGARVHLQRISSAAGVALLGAAKAEGLPVSADVSMHSLFLIDSDIGYFDSRMRLAPPLRQARDREALRAAVMDGTIDAIVSDHTPVSEDGKALPFGEAEVGATGLELLLNLTLRFAAESRMTTAQALACVSLRAAKVLGKDSLGHLSLHGQADVTVFDPRASWLVTPHNLLSHGKHTPFSGFEFEGRVRATVVNGHLAYEGGV
ncbi:MAG: dihydroorotase [Cytophagales bacterium]|nr:dihydroorotase [Cytophagales bacterium]